METKLLLPTTIKPKQWTNKRASSPGNLLVIFVFLVMVIVFIVGFENGKHFWQHQLQDCDINCPLGYQSSFGLFSNNYCQCKTTGIVDRKKLTTGNIPLLLKNEQTNLEMEIHSWFSDIIDSPIKYWKDNNINGKWEIPYEFEFTYEPLQQALIEAAFSEIFSRTCVKFRPRYQNDSSFLAIVNDENGCWSSLGKTQKSEVSLSNECLHENGINEMLIIALGFDIQEKSLWEDGKPMIMTNLTSGLLGNSRVLDGFDISRINDVYECKQEKGQVGKWSDWSLCSKSCGRGETFRYRSCVAPDGTVTSCTEKLVEIDECMTISCDFYTTVWENWSNWEKCSEKCGGGLQKRTRNCTSGHCVGLSTEFQSCNRGKCTKKIKEGSSELAQWSAWSDWGRCSVTCGEGTKLRFGECLKNGEQSKDCEGEDYIMSHESNWNTGVQHKVCKLRPCNAAHKSSIPATPHKNMERLANESHSISKRQVRFSHTFASSPKYDLVCVVGILFAGHFTDVDSEQLACYVSTGGLNVLGGPNMGFNEKFVGDEQGCWAANPYKSGEPPNIFIADFTGDGFDDYACFNHYSKYLVIQSNNQEKPFEARGIMEYYETLRFEKCVELGDYYYQVADMNGDGKADIMCGATGGPIKYVFFNNLSS